MNMKIVAVAVIAIIAVAAVGAFLLLNGNDSNESVKATGNLPVFGNANNDDAIDSKDVDLMEKLIADDTLDRSAYPFLDANQDGKLTSADVDIVKKIINREKCDIYYMDWEDKAKKQSFPVTADKICINRYFFVELLEILGITDNLKLASTNLTEDRAGIYDLPSGVVSYIGGKAPTTELILENKCDFIIADTWDTSVCEAAMEADSSITTLYIDIYSYGNLIRFVEIMGLLIDKNAEAQKYAEFVNGINEYIENGMKDVTKKSLAITHYYASSSASKTGYEVKPCSAPYLMAPLADVFNEEPNTRNGHYSVDNEWTYENYKVKFDYMLILHENYGKGLTMTKEVFQAEIAAQEEAYAPMTIVADGNMYHCVYFTITFGSYAYLPMVAHILYPDQFSEEKGWSYLQSFFDDFTSVKVDVKNEGAWFQL